MQLEKGNAGASHKGPHAGNLFLLVAGYEADGSLHVAKRKVGVVVDGSGGVRTDYHYKVERLYDAEVNSQFVPLTAGSDQEAADRLVHPGRLKYAFERGMAPYVIAYDFKNRYNLSVEQLNSTARYLKENSETFWADKDKPIIGGEVQEAIIRDGHISYPEQAEPLDEHAEPVTVDVVSNSMFSPTALPLFGRHPQTAFVDVNCEAWDFMLDNSVLIGGTYDRCNFFFDGQVFYLDPNVKPVSSTLIIGPHTNDQSLAAAVVLLPGITNFRCWKDYRFPLGEQKKLLWNRGESEHTVGIASLPEQYQLKPDEKKRLAEAERACGG